MSLEDDTDNAEIELRDLVNQTLEDNGILSKIRAQLRASLYLSLENDINTDCQYAYNETLKTKLGNPDIRIIFCLVKEFLEYFELNFTSSVFDKETFIGTSYNYENRDKLVQELDIGIDVLQNTPLLLELLNTARNNFNVSLKFNSTSNTDANKMNETFVTTIQDKLIHSEKQDSLSESASHISQHVIGVKTVPKENIQIIITNNNSSESSVPILDNEKNVTKKKPTSIQEEIQSEGAVISKKNSTISKVEDKFETDDTYEGTSSIAEDSIVSINNKEQNLIDFDKSFKLSHFSNCQKNLIDQTLDESLKSPRLTFNPDSEKRKHDKTEKLKPMSGLTSLSDLPPLQIGKNRNSDTILLPSLYSKKSPLKEIDKLLDANFGSLDNYEEDFMSSGSIENDDADENHFIPQNNMKLKKESLKSLSSKNDKSFSKKTINENEANKQDSVTASISEEFDINSNVDDLLKSDSMT